MRRLDLRSSSPAGDKPVGVAVTPNGGRVYVTNQRSGISTVSVIDRR
jgi:DNA-binding beta-propeller fold protein YncE